MEYRNLGSTGTKVSVVGIGCNNFGSKNNASQTQLIVDTAIDAGINLFDTADVYGSAGKSEEFLGKALRGKRQDVVVATDGHRLHLAPSPLTPDTPLLLPSSAATICKRTGWATAFSTSATR